MDQNLKNFRSWYVTPLKALYRRRNSGIAALMISMPLLERFLRQKSGLAGGQNLTPAFHERFRGAFPALQNAAKAKQCWIVFRHGFLHQVSLNMVSLDGAALPTSGKLTHDINQSIQILEDGTFVLNPVEFSKRVIEIIEEDFAAFAGAGSAAPELPHEAEATIPVSGGAPGAIQVVLSTSSQR